MRQQFIEMKTCPICGRKHSDLPEIPEATICPACGDEILAEANHRYYTGLMDC